VSTETGAHVGRKFVDVSHLSTYAFGHRDPMWWGVWMLIVIEGMMFSLLVTSYFYLRGNYSEWPPTGAANAPLATTLVTLVLLLASCAPMYLAFRAAWDGRLRQIQRGMLLATLVSAAAAVARGFEIAGLGYNWNSHAYGSLVWAFYFMHTLHLVAGVVENAVMTALVYRGPVEKKHMLDVRVGAIYWWFVAVSWLVIWAIVVGDDLLYRNSFVS
jgi:cytochrome c oxidase subunit III